MFNPFHVTGLFLYPRKISENLWFPDVFRGYRKRPVARNGLIVICALPGFSAIDLSNKYV